MQAETALVQITVQRAPVRTVRKNLAVTDSWGCTHCALHQLLHQHNYQHPCMAERTEDTQTETTNLQSNVPTHYSW
jgi:hypothetical protein